VIMRGGRGKGGGGANAPEQEKVAPVCKLLAASATIAL
jgi:hypothetical protein